MPRVEHLLAHGDRLPFPPFDREAMFRASRDKTLDELLAAFEGLRAESLARLDALHLVDADLERLGVHPALGVVSLRQHLSTWVAHDLSHISQIVRTMARRYAEAGGPWRAYLSVLAQPDASVPSAATPD